MPSPLRSSMFSVLFPRIDDTFVRVPDFVLSTSTSPAHAVWDPGYPLPLCFSLSQQTPTTSLNACHSSLKSKTLKSRRSLSSTSITAAHPRFSKKTKVGSRTQSSQGPKLRPYHLKAPMGSWWLLIERAQRKF